MEKLSRLCYFIPVAAYALIVFLFSPSTEEFLRFFVAILVIFGMTGITVAGFNGRTSIAVISGFAFLASCLAINHFDRGNHFRFFTLGFLFTGGGILAIAFLAHISKASSTLKIFYFIPIGVLIFSLFRAPRALLPSDGTGLAFLLFLLGITWSTIVGLNSFIHPVGSASRETEEQSVASSGAHQSSDGERNMKTWKRYLKIALFIFVFATTGIYSYIIHAVVRYAHMNFASTWAAPEPLGLENWIDHAADGFVGGFGTREDPFLISTPEQLAYLAQRVNAGTLSNAHISITADIDLAGKEWTPIGTRQHPFSGTVDGGDSAIFNLTISSPQSRQGLFGVVDNRGSLANLTLVGVNIRGRDFVGGLAGVINGGIRNSSVIGTVEGRHFVGGLSGYGFFHGVSLNAYLGNVTGEIYVGGLVGRHTLDEGDRFLAFAHATAPAHVDLIFNNVIAAVSGRRFVGGLIGHSGRHTLIRSCFFAGIVRGETFSAGISGFLPRNAGGISDTAAFLYKMDDSAGFAEIAHGFHHRLIAAVLRHTNGEWYFNSIPVSTEEVEYRFLNTLRPLRFEQMPARHRLTENILERLRSPFYVLNVPYGIEMHQDAPLSIELAGNGFSPSLNSFLGGRFWIEASHFKMSGSMRNIPRGVYAMPSSRNVNGNYETVWILLNIN